MELLKQRILQEGNVKDGDVLKVDSFLNHQMDIGLFQEIGEEFRKRFSDPLINKILTVEASGIGLAVITAQYFNNAPVIFAKKTKSKNLDGELLTAQVTSFTRLATFDLQVEARFLQPHDHILIIDDFLAKGEALKGLIEIVQKSPAQLVGCGVAVEKTFQEGGQVIRGMGVHLESLAVIESVVDGKIHFKE